MDERTMHVRVGAAILLAVAVFISSVLWVEDIHWKRTTCELEVLFKQVGSLTKGDVVSVSGIEKGSVKKLHLSEEGVLATLELDAGVMLKKDASASIRSVGIMGERFVYIDPGVSPEPYDWNKTLRGTYEPGMTEVFARAGAALSSLEILADRMDRLVAAAGEGGSLTESIENMTVFTRELRQLVEKSSGDLEATARDVRSASAYLRKLVETQGPRMERTITRFDSTSVSLARVVDQLDSLSVSLAAIGEKLQAGEGTVGMLLNDEELYLQLREAVKNTNLLIEDIKRNPHKYFKVEIF